MIRLEMEKQYDINREAPEISAFLSGKIYKCQFLTGEKYYHLIKVEQQNKLSLHILRSSKHLKDKKKTIEGQGIKQIEALKASKQE